MQAHSFNTAGNDLINNPSARCACMLVLDTSGSMSGAAIDQLNAGLRQFVLDVQADDLAAYSLELGVITAGGSVVEALPFTTAESIGSFAPLDASGNTPLGEAVTLALQRIEERKAQYRRNGVAYYQPWLVIMSDGSPTDYWSDAAAQAKALAADKKLVCLPLGVDGANMAVLSAFSNWPGKKLDGLNFGEFFKWLSASMSRVSASNSTTSGVSLPSTESWSTI